MSVQDFKKLLVWQKAHRFVLDVYRVSKGYPKEELYGITSQFRRAVVSIPANISEGCGKNSPLDFARYLQNAMGSANECEYFLLLCKDLGYLDSTMADQLLSQVEELKRMISSLLNKSRRPAPATPTLES